MNDTVRDEYKTVVTRPRQVRVAYLIDSSTVSMDLLDAIFATCSRVWGGRLSPIIPVQNGEITEDYWKLLRRIDPDSIYSYTNLPLSVVERIVKEVTPHTLRRHSENLLTGERPHYAPGIEQDLARVHGVLPFAVDTGWLPSPSLLTYTGDAPVDPMIARNFGLLRSEGYFNGIPEDLPQKAFESHDRFADLLGLIGSQPGRLISAYGATCARAVCNTGSEGAFEHRLFVGNTPSDWVAWWNDIFTAGPTQRREWGSLCLDPEQFQDEAFLKALRPYLKKAIHGTGSSNLSVRLVSSSYATPEHLQSIAQQLSDTKIRFHVVSSLVPPWRLAALPGGRDQQSEFVNEAGINRAPVFASSVHQIPASGGLVDPPELPFAGSSGGHWMRDFVIDQRPSDPSDDGDEFWYKLPRKQAVPRLFSELRGRIDGSGHLSLMTQYRGAIHLKIPDDASLLSTAMGLGRRFEYSETLETKLVPPAFEGHSPSDKAKYCNGVIQLFGGLRYANQRLANRFWRRALQRLANLPNDDSTANPTVVNSIRKNVKKWSVNRECDREAEIARLASQIESLARQVRTAQIEMTYEQLWREFQKERAEALTTFAEDIGELSDEEEAAQLHQEEAQLKRALQLMVNRRVLLQGIVAHCPTCGSRLWLELDSIRHEFDCSGCRGTVHPPIDARWYYRLNSLLINAIGHHGTVPVIQALASARKQARSCFIYSPGIALFDNYQDAHPSAEIDFVCCVDGELWAGEVKSQLNAFSDSEIEKLVLVAKRIGADKAVIYAPTDDVSRLTKRCTTATEQHRFPVEALRLRSSLNEPVLYVG